MRRTIWLRTLLLAVATLGLISCLGQDENIQSSSHITDKKVDKVVNDTTDQQHPQNAHSTQKIPLQQGVTVAVDSETGQLRAPTAEEKQTLRLQERQLKVAGGLEEKVLPDGTVMIDLKGQLQHQINAEVITDCEQNNKNKACSQKVDNKPDNH